MLRNRDGIFAPLVLCFLLLLPDYIQLLLQSLHQQDSRHYLIHFLSAQMQVAQLRHDKLLVYILRSEYAIWQVVQPFLQPFQLCPYQFFGSKGEWHLEVELIIELVEAFDACGIKLSEPRKPILEKLQHLADAVYLRYQFLQAFLVHLQAQQGEAGQCWILCYYLFYFVEYFSKITTIAVTYRNRMHLCDFPNRWINFLIFSELYFFFSIMCANNSS